MALPAGRYGVTKNQLLKIKKLPMNTIKLIEELTEKFNLLGTAAFKNSTSVVTESSDLVESGAVYTALQGKADNSVIGTVEDGTNPTKAYAVGEHMVRGEKFCTVTVPVTTSSTWMLDRNYVEGDVATLLNPVITEATPESGITLGSQKQVCRVGNVVNLRINFTCASNLSADDAIAQTGYPVFGSINQLIAIEGLNVLAYVAPSGFLKAKGVIPAGTYTAYGTYICK